MSTNTTCSATRRKRQKGSVMVEFAVGSTILMLLLFGVADFGRLFYASIEVQNAAAAGASFGSLSTANMTNTTGISTAAKYETQNLTGVTVTSSKVCQGSTGTSVTCTTSGTYQYSQVTVSYTFNTLYSYPLIPSSVALAKTVMMRAQ